MRKRIASKSSGGRSYPELKIVVLVVDGVAIQIVNPDPPLAETNEIQNKFNYLIQI